MQKFDPRQVFALGLALCALGIAALLAGAPQPVRAQLSSVTTWIPASGVGGSANAVTLTVPNIGAMSDLLGVPLRFLPKSTNAAGGTTIAVNSLSAESVLRVSTSVGGGLLVPIAGGDFGAATLGSAGFPYVEVLWDGTEFVQNNPATGNAAVGSEISLTAPSVPNGYLIENGACVSQTTYAALYVYYGGSGDLWLTQAGGVACSAGQFHLPFANGRAAVAFDQQGSVTAGVLTNAGSGCNATAVAVGCGAQNRSLSSTNQLPQFTPSGSIGGSQTFDGVWSGGGSLGQPGDTQGQQNLTVNGSNFTFTGNPIGSASPSPFTTVQPTYTVFKAVKY